MRASAARKANLRTLHQLVPAALIAAIITANFGSAAFSATTTWNGPVSGGVFNDDANWTLNSPGDNTPPPNGPNDLAIFNATTNVNGTITFDADATHQTTQFRSTSGTITFNTGAFKWTTTGQMVIGAGAGETNTLRHVGGTIDTGTLLLGNNAAAANSSIEVTGAGTVWNFTATNTPMRVGSGGSPNSTFTIHNGAKVTAAGQITVGLAGSTNGRLFVTDTGVLEGANYLGLGNGAGTTGNEVHILDGGTVKATHTLMGIATGGNNGRTLISGTGSTLTLTGVGSQSQVGMVGTNNTLEIVNGGSVLGTNRVRVGVNVASTGNKIILNNGTLTGASIEVERGDVTITASSVDLTDYFSMTDSAYVQGTLSALVAGTSSITFNSGSVKTVKSNINNGLPFVVGDGGATPATFQMKKTTDNLLGTHTFVNGLSLSSNAILSGVGNIVGNVSGMAGAQVDVGTSPGIIGVTGSWNNTGLAINLEVDDLSSSLQAGVNYDLLDVTGAFTHGGSVTIDRSQFVPPSTSQLLKVIGWTSEVGPPSVTSVSFSGGGPIPYLFASDGLYLAVPEPAAMTILVTAVGTVMIGLRRRNPTLHK